MHRLAGAALLAGIIVAAAPPEAHAGEAPTATDANLVTALDVSDSIMRHEEWIEFAGMIQAIQSDDFLDAVTAGRHGRIGFAVIVWSSAKQPDLVVPWTIIESNQDIQRVVDRLSAAPTVYGFDARMGNGEGVAAHRGDDGGRAAPARRTDLSVALEFSTDLLRTAPFVAAREVINICGNGVDNVQASPAAARDRALSAGMVVNGLVIGARPGVADYYRAHVQGGTGSFVLEASDPKDIAAAMLQKFLRDLNVSREPPGRARGSIIRDAGRRRAGGKGQVVLEVPGAVLLKPGVDPGPGARVLVRRRYGDHADRPHPSAIPVRAHTAPGAVACWASPTTPQPRNEFSRWLTTRGCWSRSA